jgi:hypothetical protein
MAASESQPSSRISQYTSGRSSAERQNPIVIILVARFIFSLIHQQLRSRQNSPCDVDAPTGICLRENSFVSKIGGHEFFFARLHSGSDESSTPLSSTDSEQSNIDAILVVPRLDR